MEFGKLTDRMNKYRNDVLDKKPYIDATRAVLATEVYKANQHQPSVMKRALMLKNIFFFADPQVHPERWKKEESSTSLF